MAPSFTVIIPTCGRPTFEATLASVVSQAHECDQVVIVGDGPQPEARRLFWREQPVARAHISYMEAQHPASRFGNYQRDAGMWAANGSHLLFLDDDDIYQDGALDAIRATVQSEPTRPHIFRAWWGPGHHAYGVTLWSEPVVREQNIATPMVVLPRRHYSRMWMDGNDAGIVSDFRFLEAAIFEAGDPVFHTEIVATVRP